MARRIAAERCWSAGDLCGAFFCDASTGIVPTAGRSGSAHSRLLITSSRLPSKEESRAVYTSALGVWILPIRYQTTGPDRSRQITGLTAARARGATADAIHTDESSPTIALQRTESTLPSIRHTSHVLAMRRYIAVSITGTGPRTKACLIAALGLAGVAAYTGVGPTVIGGQPSAGRIVFDLCGIALKACIADAINSRTLAAGLRVAYRP